MCVPLSFSLSLSLSLSLSFSLSLSLSLSLFPPPSLALCPSRSLSRSLFLFVCGSSSRSLSVCVSLLYFSFSLSQAQAMVREELKAMRAEGITSATYEARLPPMPQISTQVRVLCSCSCSIGDPRSIYFTHATRRARSKAGVIKKKIKEAYVQKFCSVGWKRRHGY